MYSRRLHTEEKENKRKTKGFVLLTIAAVLFMYFFGIPSLVKLSNFAYDLKKSGEPIDSDDKTPPPPPIFEEVPTYTKSDRAELKGRTEAGAIVTIYINNGNEDLVANSEGQFSHTFSLREGENTIYAVAKDSGGNASRESDHLSIIHDVETPELEIITPKDGETLSGARNRQIQIEGTTEVDARVQVNGHLSIVDSGGKFVYPTNLTEGENKFTVKAEDLAGNYTEIEVTITYYP